MTAPDQRQPSRETTGGGGNGYFMLVALLVIVVVGALGIFATVTGNADAIKLTLIAGFGFAFIVPGFYKLQPNEAAAITLFGAYRGTDRNHGLRWTWPWMGKQIISLRAHNLISQTIKVNDQRGNPIEIAAQVVWRVTDSAQALFDVDDYMGFVAAQIEVAVRTIGARYPYDDFEHKEVTLRGDHDRISEELRAELMNRLSVAGITVDECGFTHLA
jgi:regulator of protease activity HflC (stomatin/prohibitin superfamily)